MGENACSSYCRQLLDATSTLGGEKRRGEGGEQRRSRGGWGGEWGGEGRRAEEVEGWVGRRVGRIAEGGGARGGDPGGERRRRNVNFVSRKEP